MITNDVYIDGIKIPLFVRLGGSGTAMRLTSYSLKKHSGTYHRDGGLWDLNFKIKDGKLISVMSSKDLKHLNGHEFIETTFTDWFNDNGRYAYIFASDIYKDDEDNLPF